MNSKIFADLLCDQVFGFDETLVHSSDLLEQNVELMCSKQDRVSFLESGNEQGVLDVASG